jgi:hypothetical protein
MLIRHDIAHDMELRAGVVSQLQSRQKRLLAAFEAALERHPEVGDAMFAHVAQVRKFPFFAPFLYYKMIVLPRQARDKHREDSQKEMRFSVGSLLLVPEYPGGAGCVRWRSGWGCDLRGDGRADPDRCRPGEPPAEQSERCGAARQRGVGPTTCLPACLPACLPKASISKRLTRIFFFLFS